MKRGCPFVTRGNKGKEWAFNSKDVIEWLKADAVEREIGRADSPDIDAARLRKVLAEAQLAELDLDRQRGKLLSVSVVTQLVVASFTRVRTRFLALPTKLTPFLIGQAEHAVVYGIVERGVDEALAELSEQAVMGAAVKQSEAA